MNCTSCKKGKLQPGYLDDLFPAHNCNNCGGNWIKLEDYLRWRETAAPELLTQPEGVNVSEMEAEADETKRAVMCPVHGTIMLKYRISKDHSHRIDINPAINAIWLDKGEWALIKAEGLSGSLNKIFTAPWQRNIKEQNAADVLDASYRNQLGDEDYEKLKEMRAWLDDKEKRNIMVAYLAARDPLSAIR